MTTIKEFIKLLYFRGGPAIKFSLYFGSGSCPRATSSHASPRGIQTAFNPQNLCWAEILHTICGKLKLIIFVRFQSFIGFVINCIEILFIFYYVGHFRPLWLLSFY